MLKVIAQLWASSTHQTAFGARNGSVPDKKDTSLARQGRSQTWRSVR